MYYLAYNSGCEACTSISSMIASIVGDSLELTSLADEQTLALLNRAYPSGWTFAPYLIKTAGAKVEAWTGLPGALRLSLVIGPRKTFKLLKALRSLSFERVEPSDPPRRRFLKLSVYGAAAVGAFAVLGLPRLAYAQGCIFENGCVAIGSGCYSCGIDLGFGEGTEYDCPSEACTTYVFSCCSCC